MAFCKNCGTDLNGARICFNCGVSAGEEVAVQTGAAARTDTRQHSMAEMEKVVKYFGEMAAQYDEYEAVSAEVDDRNNRGFGGKIVLAIVCLLAALLFEGLRVIGLILMAGFVVWFILGKKNNKEKLAAAVEKKAAIDNELHEHYNAYGYCPIGFEYTKPSVLNAIYERLSGGRASTISDALNIYVADLQTEEARRLQEEANRLATETLEEQKKIRKAVKSQRRWGIASFILKR